MKPLKALLKTCGRQIYTQLVRLKPWLPLSDAQWARLALLSTLVQRDMSARYQGSTLGNLWPLINQVAMLLVYTYVFSVVLQVKLSLKGLPADNSFIFGLWLFAGLIPWSAFSEGVIQASYAVINQTNLVKKVVFPLTLLPLVPVFSRFIESTFGLAALIGFLLLMNQSLPPTVFLLPLVWLPQLCLTVGIGYCVASLTVFIRDIPQSLSVLLNLWFYATPIIYPAELIPSPFREWVFWLNPMAAIAEMNRDLLLVGEINHWGEWAIATLISIMVLCVGAWCYDRLKLAFADVL